MMRTVFLLIMLICVSGCSTPRSFDYVEIAPKIEAISSPIQTIPHGKIRLKIRRTNELMYIAVKAVIKINGVEVSGLYRNDTFEGIYNAGDINVSVDAWSAPGSYTLSLHAESDAEYILEVSPRQESLSDGYPTDYGMSTAAPFKLALMAIHH